MRNSTCDSPTKFEWFFADLCTAVWAGLALLVAELIIIVVIYSFTGVDLIALAETYWSPDTVLDATFMLAFVTAFTIVFVFRFNPIMNAPPRRFRYFHRWL